MVSEKVSPKVRRVAKQMTLVRQVVQLYYTTRALEKEYGKIEQVIEFKSIIKNITGAFTGDMYSWYASKRLDIDKEYNGKEQRKENKRQTQQSNC